MTYYAVQRFVGVAGQDGLRAKYADPVQRRRFHISSLIWGSGLLTESLLRVPTAFLLPIDIAVGASNVLMVVAFTSLIAWTIRFTKRSVAIGEATTNPSLDRTAV